MSVYINNKLYLQFVNIIHTHIIVINIGESQSLGGWGRYE